VLGENPTGQFDESLGREVDPATWRKLTLRAPKRDGTYADVVLLRPQWWLDERGATVGGTALIAVPECGIDGNAEVLAIEPCSPLASGTGPVVTATFRHQSAQVLDLHIEGHDDPIGTTANHPFWSEDRRSFVRADALRVGERLRGMNGPTRVRKIVPIGVAEPVFNLEVLGQHVYRVGASAILVHNGADDCFKFAQKVVNEQSGGGVIIIEPLKPVPGAKTPPYILAPPGYPVAGQPNPPFSEHFITIIDGNVHDPAFPSGIPIDNWMQQWADKWKMSVEMISEVHSILPYPWDVYPATISQ